MDGVIVLVYIAIFVSVSPPAGGEGGGVRCVVPLVVVVVVGSIVY